MVTFHAVPRALLHEVFDELRDEIGKASSYSMVLDVDDLLLLAQSGRLGVLAVVMDGGVVGAAIWEVITFPNNRLLNVVAMAGKTGYWTKYSRELIKELERIGAEWGCSRITAVGRRGWVSAAKRLGFTTEHRAVVTKEIEVHGQGRRHTGNGHDVGTLGSSASSAAEPDPKGAGAL